MATSPSDERPAPGSRRRGAFLPRADLENPPKEGGEDDGGSGGETGGRRKTNGRNPRGGATKGRGEGRPPAARGVNGRRRDSLPASSGGNPPTVASRLSSRLRHGDGTPAFSTGGAKRRRGSLGGAVSSSGSGVRARSPSPAAGRRTSAPAATSLARRCQWLFGGRAQMRHPTQG